MGSGISPGQDGVWWAREELNLRPLPCQQNPGNRCANRRSPRSDPTVDAEGKRSLDVQLNALFAHSYILPQLVVVSSTHATSWRRLRTSNTWSQWGA